MKVRKAFIKQDGEVLLPITRGEVVLDSSGGQALHSTEFLATSSTPGLITPEEKTIIGKALIVNTSIPENKVIQVYHQTSETEAVDVYPTTIAEAIQVTVNKKSTTLDKVITPILNMDTVPTQSSTNAVTSGGVWQHIDDTVGAIHRTINNI